MNEALHRRARQVRANATVRAWEYRQRRYAKGTWFRLRRVLANAREAYVVPEEATRLLIDEGYRPEPVGEELEPAKTILFVPESRVARIAERKAIPVRLDSELLVASCLVLVRFATDQS